jgi:DNA-directed RNA polymerase specialized sigma24 family protein
MSASQGSITIWFKAFKDGDRDGARKLWDRFSRRLLGLARRKLQHAPRRAADEEDVALSAFDSFCRGVEKGRFADLLDRDDLWQLLVLITVRKAVDLLQHEGRLKRGGGQEADGDRPVGPAEEHGADDLTNLLSREPSPELAAIMAEECGRLLSRLEDDELRAIVLLRMEGYTDDEIAARIGCARRTVQRRLQVIRRLWEQEAA